jgi:hypothetical protein
VEYSLHCGPYSSKLENPFTPRYRYHPSRRAAGIWYVNFPFLQLLLNFWWKSHAKWAKLKYISLIISDQGKKTKIPSRHNLDISINYIPTQCGLQIWCFAIAIKFFVKTHTQITWHCMIVHEPYLTWWECLIQNILFFNSDLIYKQRELVVNIVSTARPWAVFLGSTDARK